MPIVPEPWALVLLGLFLSAIVGVALYGTGAGLAGVLLGIEAKGAPIGSRRPAGGMHAVWLARPHRRRN